MISLSQLKNDHNLISTIDALKAALPQDVFQKITRGIEKENLRVTLDGKLAQTPHPAALGKALTHPTITLDFSDALIEMITPPLQGYDLLNRYLLTLNRFIVDNIVPENLWPFSMPPQINDQLEVSIADFGSSNVAKMKTIYRVGLWHRYGRIMQAIAGLHYNISFPDTFFKELQKLWQQTEVSFSSFRSAVYMKLVRNFYRYAWLLPYLFGASPVCAKSSVGHAENYLQQLDEQHMFAPFGTSLRMSDLGYQNSIQANLDIDLNSVSAYGRSLFQATRTPSDEFKKIAVKEKGVYQQLNQNILQIENEHYSFIRPKAKPVSGEPPSISLCCNGVEYIEVRLLDLNPLMPLGIDLDTQVFMDSFLLFCMLTDDYKSSPESVRMARANFQRVCTKGREPNLQLADGRDFKSEALALLAEIKSVALLLNSQQQTVLYTESLQKQVDKLNDARLTPSAKILAGLEERKISYQEYCLEQMQAMSRAVVEAECDAEFYQQIINAVQHSLSDWQQQEKQPQDFDRHLENYMAKNHRCTPACD